MRGSLTACMYALLGLTTSACHRAPAVVSTPRVAATSSNVTAASAHTSRPTGVAWFEGNVAQAFIAAEQPHKPVFVYFGAVWCPPCQELKATVFRRQDFLGKLSLFVPVYLDGDAPDAERWATEFKITGYPTALILRSNRAELERVSGGMDLSRYSEVLDLGLSATRPINDILAAVTSGDPTITLEDCRRLAYNGWPLEDEWIFSEDDPGWLEKLSDALTQAAGRCPAEAAIERARLSIVAMAATLEVESKSLKTGRRPSAKLASSVERVREVIADRTLAISAADELEFLDDTFFKTAAKLDPTHAAALEPTWFHLMDAICADQPCWQRCRADRSRSRPSADLHSRRMRSFKV